MVIWNRLIESSEVRRLYTSISSWHSFFQIFILNFNLDFGDSDVITEVEKEDQRKADLTRLVDSLKYMTIGLKKHVRFFPHINHEKFIQHVKKRNFNKIIQFFQFREPLTIIMWIATKPWKSLNKKSKI